MKAAYIVAFAGVILLAGCVHRPLTAADWALEQQMFNRPPMPAPIPPAQPANATPRPKNCISNIVGNTIYTNCY